MKPQQSLIGNRYLYNLNQPLHQTPYLTIYRTYDKVTKRDLSLHIHHKSDTLIDSLREYKHAFISFIFDKVEMDDGKVGYVFQSGVQGNLQQGLMKIRHFNEQDALVVFKYVLLMVKELHSMKNILVERLCLENILICNYALFKLGHYVLNQDYPMEYMAPERLQGKQPTVQSDIYSLGVMLYKMLYGQYPFKGQNSSELSKKIKSKKFEPFSAKSPLQIVISREVHFLVLSMLDFYEDNRPDLDTVLSNSCFNFEIQTDLPKYLKPKGSIVPQNFHKKYLVFRPSKIVTKYGDYYSEAAYLVFNVNSKTFMTMYAPQVRMFQAQPRKIQSYYEKIRALQKNYQPNGCEYLVKVDDIERFKQQPIIATQYCNQGNLYSYLQKRKIFKGWITENEANVLMYLMAIALKQIKTLGITSIHTISHQRIMIHNANIKLRQPGIITPVIQKKLQINEQIDFFAPQLKQKLDFVQLDKSDIWSYGVLYIYLLTSKMPELDDQNQIDLTKLKTNRKNVNVIGKCLDFNVKKRMELENIKLENINETLLNDMLIENRQSILLKEQYNEEEKEIIMMEQKLPQYDNLDPSQLSSNAQQLKQNKKVMFKRRKRRLFKHYNKIISQSTTTPCRLIIKTAFGLIILWLLFFGIFFVNGGIGLLRTNFYRKITLQVPYNYGTSLYNMTILSTNGAVIKQLYHDYSYEQFTIDLKCAQNNYSENAQGQVWDFANGSQTVFCLFGFIWAIMISILYIIQTHKLDLPAIFVKRKQKQSNKQLYHFISMHFVMPSLLFTFFYTFAFQYIIQMTPCFGIQDLAYPKFTSIQSILNNDLGTFFLNVFLTVGIWAILMFCYGYLSFFVKKVGNLIFEWIGIGVFVTVMILFTVICRVGFGTNIPIEPTWTYKMNLDIIEHHFGLFGFFPEILWIIIVVASVLIDFIFWIFLKIGLEPPEEQDIKKVAVIKAKFQRLDTKDRELGHEKSNIYMIENAYDFERFD